MVQDVSDLARRQPDVEGHEDRADAHRPEFRVEHRRDVRRQDRNPVSTADSETSQCLAEAADAITVLRVGVNTLPVNDRGFVRIHEQAALQERQW